MKLEEHVEKSAVTADICIWSGDVGRFSTANCCDYLLTAPAEAVLWKLTAKGSKRSNQLLVAKPVTPFVCLPPCKQAGAEALAFSCKMERRL